jgi:diguanylate cyclase (GGDEF)-like protein/PAS domain S-box-containing protein
MADPHGDIPVDDHHLTRLGGDQEQVRAALRAHCGEVIEFGPDGVVIADRDGRIQLVNAQAERLFGYAREELLGQPVEALLPERLRADHVAHRNGFAADPRTRSMGAGSELLGRRRDGSEFPVDITLAPLNTERGTFLAAAVRDVTDRRRAEMALQESESRYRSLIAALADGIILMSGDAEIIDANPAAERMLGVTREDLTGRSARELMRRFVRRDGKPMSAGDVSTARALSEGRPVRGETIGIHLPDGSLRWLSLSAEPLSLTDGSGVVISFTDVTAAVEAVREQEALRRVATLVAAEADARGVFDAIAQESAAACSAQLAGVLRFGEGCTTGVLVGAWAADDALEPRYGVAQALDPGTAVGAVGCTGASARLDAGRGGPIHHNVVVPGTRVTGVVATPVVVDGRLWGCLTLATTEDRPLSADAEVRLGRLGDIASLAIASAEARAQLARLASTDHLTGLPNRRAFQERLAGEIERARRHGRALSLVLVDIDHFKRVNDTHGHPAGDRVLVEVAARLDALVRGGGTVARVGGEEFAVILPEADGRSAVAAAERLRLAIEGAEFAEAGALTVSAGVCAFEGAFTEDDLFRLADAALYRAKAQGRNRVVCHVSGEAATVPRRRDPRPPPAPGV